MAEKSKMNRRQFLATMGAAAGAPFVIRSGVLAAAGAPGANERMAVALIGSGGRGQGLINEIRRSKIGDRVECIAYCDVDENRLADRVKWAARYTKKRIMPYRDYRHVLERKDIDGVVIATPDHWHAVQMVHSAECGKHIYVEKPACCTIEEGKAMVRAAKENKVTVQVGSQGRSQPEAYLSHRYLVNDNIGHISKVWAFHYNSPEDNRPVPDSDPPPEMDWDMWLGPLRWRPYNKRYHHGVFRWI